MAGKAPSYPHRQLGSPAPIAVGNDDILNTGTGTVVTLINGVTVETTVTVVTVVTIR